MFGERIQNYINEQGIKQVYLAKKLNISNQSLNYMLNNPKSLKVEDYNKICDALNLPFSFFAKEQKHQA